MMNDIGKYLLGGGRLDSDRAVGLLQAKDLRGLTAGKDTCLKRVATHENALFLWR